MGLLFPLFLIAASAILIPIVIHLVNLRRYKQEIFPNIRFLRRLQISSKKSSKLRRRWLLLTRILFLLTLVLAFSQPFFYGQQEGKNTGVETAVLYIDNSLSMSVQKQGNALLNLAKSKALQLIQEAPVNAQFVVLSNDQFYFSSPVDKNEASQKINQITLSNQTISLEDIKNLLEIQLPSAQQRRHTAVYLFSDFQKSTLLPSVAQQNSISGFNFYLVPLQMNQLENISVDSVWVQRDEKESGTPFQLVVKLHGQNIGEEGNHHLQLMTNRETRLIKPVAFQKGNTIVYDTLPVSFDQSGWLNATLILNDASVSFDDTFRVAAKIPTGYAVLVLSKNGLVNAYLQSAFRSMPGVDFKAADLNNLNQENVQKYSLIVVQNGEDATGNVASFLKKALENGANVLVFPGANEQQTALNTCLQQLAGIRLGTLDTAKEQVVTLQKNHPLLKGIFTTIPNQVQLPIVNAHFPVTADLQANEQDIMDLADGNPLLTSFNLGGGDLYLCTSSLNGESSNFPLSYFFAPLLYNMTVPGGAVQQFVSAVGSGEAVLIPNHRNNDNQHLWHLTGRRTDVVPPQKAGNGGWEVFAGKSVDKTGFYLLKQDGNDKDSFWMAVNTNPLESALAPASVKAIESALAPSKVIWIDEQKVAREGWMPVTESFPLWKITILLALLSLIAETILLINPPFKKEASQKSPAEEVV